MLRIKKQLVPLYEGEAKRGFLHVVLVDEKGYPEMIDFIDKHDHHYNNEELWPEYKSFAGLAYERTHKNKHKDWWVIFPVNGGRKITRETIAHEALHISRMILTDRGVIFDPNNDEPYAYMVGRITGMIHKMIPKNQQQ